MIFVLLGFLLPPSHAAVPASLPRADFCRMILSPAGTQALTDSVVNRIGAQLSLAKINGQFSYMQDMRAVMADLVQKGTITEPQAESLFAENVLGSFSRVFLKFTIAELLGRGFAQKDIVHFLVHFDEAFLPDRQVQFAIDVSRRMLLTINEDTGLSSPQGIQDFLTAAEAFKIPSDAYANFLQLWAFVRESEPRTIVHFILSNITNSGHAIRDEIERELRMDEPKAPVPERGNFFATLFAGAGPVPAARPQRSFESVAQELLEIKNIPPWILQVEGLTKVEPKSFLLRYQQKPEGTIQMFLTSLEKHPPFAREFIIDNQLANLTFPTLDAFSHTSVYRNLGEDTRAHGDQILTDFRELQALEAKLKTALDAAEPKQIVATTEAPASSRRQTTNLFVTGFDQRLLSNVKISGPIVYDAIINSYEQVANELGFNLTPQEFMDLAIKAIDRAFVKQDIEIGKSAAKALAVISHDFVLTSDQLQELNRIMKTHRFYHGSVTYPVTTFDAFKPFMPNKNWGSSQTVEATPPASPPLSPEAKVALTEIKDFLAQHNIFFDSLEMVAREFARAKTR